MGALRVGLEMAEEVRAAVETGRLGPRRRPRRERGEGLKMEEKNEEREKEELRLGRTRSVRWRYCSS